MNRLLKQAGLGVVMAATTVAATTPADAQRWRGGYRDYHRGGGSGRLATGALLGGIVGLGVGAAIASSNRGRSYDRGGYHYDAPPRVVYRERYYAPPPPVVVRERVYEPGYYGGYGGYGGGYYDRGYGYGGW